MSTTLETFKAFLQDEKIREKYELSDADVAVTNMMGKPGDKMIVTLIREMVNKYAEVKSPRITASHLNTVLDNRL